MEQGAFSPSECVQAGCRGAWVPTTGKEKVGKEAGKIYLGRTEFRVSEQERKLTCETDDTKPMLEVWVEGRVEGAEGHGEEGAPRSGNRRWVYWDSLLTLLGTGALRGACMVAKVGGRGNPGHRHPHLP